MYIFIFTTTDLNSSFPPSSSPPTNFLRLYKYNKQCTFVIHSDVEFLICWFSELSHLQCCIYTYRYMNISIFL